MKANELMIGDWVMYHNHIPMKITQLSPDFDDMDDLNPIPLTGEILKKNGFKEGTYSILGKGGYKSFPEYKYINREEITDTSKNLIKVSYSDENGGVYDISFGIGSHIFDLKYVHELQHALRLCGIEKEIEL